MTTASRPQHHVIYIPGLGDRKNVRGQRLAVATWRNYGLRGHLCQMHWADKQPFEPKFDGLLALIDELVAAGHIVSLVASSAGASAAVNAYAKRRDVIASVVLFCGKIQHPETISQAYFSENPAFKTSMELVAGSLKELNPDQRSRILSIHPYWDNIVPVADTYIEGARMRNITSFGHSTTIAMLMTIDFFIPLGFLLYQARQFAKNMVK